MNFIYFSSFTIQHTQIIYFHHYVQIVQVPTPDFIDALFAPPEIYLQVAGQRFTKISII